MKNTQIFISAVLAGSLVGAAGLAFLLLRETYPIAGAILFGAALVAILTLNLHLFTAKAGYLLWDSSMISKLAVHLCISLCGNTVGAVGIGLALGYAYPDRSFAEAYVTERLNGNALGTIVGALLCGMLMFVAIHGYMRSRGEPGGVLVLFGASSAIMLCNFDHLITDLFFAAFMRMCTLRILSMLLLVAAGNAFGAILFALLYEYKKSDEEVERELEEAEAAAEHSHRRTHRTHGDGSNS